VHVACEARTRTALTRAEARRVWRWCAQEISGLKQLSVGLMLVGGLRAVEVSRISGNDVANNGQKLTVSGKGGKTRVVFFDGAVAKWLDSWVKNGEESPEIQSVYRAGKEAWEVAGRGQSGSSHGLRRTAATLLIERGATIDQVQEFLGHSSAATTARCYVIRRSRLPRLGIGR
jgi:integrase/recombinase XerD